MNNIKSFYLCIDMGDLIYSLLFAKLLNVNTLYIDGGCNTVKFNWKSAEFLLPLLQSQKYIEKAELYNNQQYDNNYGLHPNNMPVTVNTNLLNYHASKFDMDYNQINTTTWLTSHIFDDPIVQNKKILINRTSRYHGDESFYHKMLSSFNPQYFLFAGLEEEYTNFSKRFNTNIDYIKTENSVDLLSIVNTIPIFLGNQSLICALATGLGKTCYIEIGRYAANYLFNRQNIFYF